MKIVCDSCGAKYSIADEKVAGKVFKIRCKKCQNIIVVRGNQPEEQAPMEPAAGSDPGYGADAGQDDAYGDQPVWHVVIDREQVGPMTPSDVRDRYASGDINEETFIWREGFSDWLRLDAVDDFADIAQATKVAPASVAMGGAAALSAGAGDSPAEPAWSSPEAESQEPAGAWPAEGGADNAASTEAWAAAPQQEQASEPEPAAQEPAPQAAADSAQLAYRDPGQERRRDLFATYAGEESVSDLMGSGALPGGAGGGIPGNAQVSFQPSGDAAGASAPAADAGGGGTFSADPSVPADESNLTGQRNENSVLFSLSNLQQLAMGKPASPEPLGGGEAASEGDGSGLIDIRAMAGGSVSGGGLSGDDDLGDLGTYAAPVSAAPVLLPSVDDDRPKWLMPLIVGMAATLVVMIGLVLFLLMRKTEAPVVATAPTTKPAKAPGAAKGPAPAKASDKKPAAAPAAEKKDDPSAAAPSAAATPEKKKAAPAKAASKPKATASRSTTRRKRSSSPSRSSAKSDPILGSSSPPSRKKKRGRKKDDLDALIDNAIADKPKRKKKASSRSSSRKSSRGSSRSSSRSSASSRSKPASSSSNLPETLSRNDIQKGMRSIKGKVQGCYDRYKVPGLASVQITIGRAGRVTSTKVKGVFAGTPTGACVQKAARSARFPKFKGTPITITYPFILR